ncbi:MAG: MotA/TolQ/ExbB proton channel family protein [Nevskiaceae bacterium]|nr:MAG: MotA/TolQ/ExbB proton channel family protein [Nevskiaceae bacterium]TBR74129.1 MAG: MotA/TolQ/ExbB proton channel family protein [Nevskiaceae bacterium]
MNLFSTIAHFFQNGGIFMYPILVLLILGLAIIIERAYFITRARRENRILWDRLVPLVNQGDYAAAEQLAADSDTAIGRVLGGGIARARAPGATRDSIETVMDESLMEVTPQLEQRTPFLAVFANVATLMGLLGTIVGLIEGFGAVSTIDAAQKADDLSHAVSVALNCTAFGLLVAIPFLLVHAWLQSRTDSLIDNIETAAVKFMNSLSLSR